MINAYGSVPDSTHYAVIPYDPTTQTLTTDTIDSDLNWYYLSGVLTARPLLSTVATWSTLAITANGSSTATLGSGLPNPTTITIIVPGSTGIAQVAPQTITSGSFSLTTTQPGTYVVETSCFPYVDTAVSIIAT